ncbi:MAG TPA: hypothetical protein VLW55_06925 [Burkholderiaceae bacterium]|nr:hypothetical protein [Burkholderiaceae bacterium]
MAAFERATVGLFLWWSANAALTDDPARAPSVSRFSVAETAERIECGARARGLKVLARTDHSGAAARDGFRLQPTQSLLVDGMSGEALRLVVWRARTGLTMVSLGPNDAGHGQAFEAELQWLHQALSAQTRDDAGLLSSAPQATL